MKTSPSKPATSRTAKTSAPETRQTIRLVAPPTPQEIDNARAVLMHAGFLRIIQIEAELEQEVFATMAIAPEAGPVHKALSAMCESLTAFANVRFHAANLVTSAKNGGVQ